MKNALLLTQRILLQLGYKIGRADGVIGPLTISAIQQKAGPQAWLSEPWSNERKAIAFLQWYARTVLDMEKETGRIDGLYGPQTAYITDSIQFLEKHGNLPVLIRDDQKGHARSTIANPHQFPKMDYNSMVEYYGKEGTDQVTMELPFPMVLAWDVKTTVNKMQCHRRVHDSLKRVLTLILQEYGIDRIRELRIDHFGGCLNVRKQRGGNNWSTHAWGAAIDIDPMHNSLKWNDTKATLDDPPYERMWSFFESEGWVSLGRARNYDWMHVQAARL